MESSVKRTMFGVLVVGVLGLVVACDRDRAPAPAVVRLGYFPNLTHAQAVLGVASGDFARALAPARLETRVFNAGPALVEALFAGEIDVAYIGPAPAIMAFARSEGQALRIMGGAASNGVVLVARPDAGITALQDLRGRRLATPQLGNTQDLSARHFIAQALGDVDAVEIIPMPGPEQQTMLRRGQIDAAWMVEPWASRLIVEGGGTAVLSESDLWAEGEFSLTVLVATPAFLRDRPDLARRLLAEHHRWTVALREDPSAQIAPLEEALFQLSGKRLPDGVLEMALGRVRFIDRVDRASLEAFGAWAHELGYIRRPVAVDALLAMDLQEQEPVQEDRP